MLKDMVAELAGMGIGFEITGEAKALIVDKAYTPRYGARPIRREIQTSIEDAVSGLILSSDLGEGSIVRVEVLNGEIKVNNISK